MGHQFRLLLLILVTAFSAQSRAESVGPISLQAGQKITGLTLPTLDNDFGFSIDEQLGHPVMLLWAGECSRCSAELESYERLQQRYASAGLITRVIWTTEEPLLTEAPQTDLPVLVYSNTITNAWSVEPQPAVMLINADGQLEYLFAGKLGRSAKLTSRALQHMVAVQDNPGSIN